MAAHAQVVYPALADVPPGAYLVHSCSQDVCPPSDAVSFQGAQQRCFDAACKLLETTILTNDLAARFWCADRDGGLLCTHVVLQLSMQWVAHTIPSGS